MDYKSINGKLNNINKNDSLTSVLSYAERKYIFDNLSQFNINVINNGSLFTTEEVNNLVQSQGNFSKEQLEILQTIINKEQVEQANQQAAASRSALYSQMVDTANMVIDGTGINDIDFLTEELSKVYKMPKGTIKQALYYRRGQLHEGGDIATIESPVEQLENYPNASLNVSGFLSNLLNQVNQSMSSQQEESNKSTPLKDLLNQEVPALSEQQTNKPKLSELIDIDNNTMIASNSNVSDIGMGSKKSEESEVELTTPKKVNMPELPPIDRTPGKARKGTAPVLNPGTLVLNPTSMITCQNYVYAAGGTF